VLFRSVSEFVRTTRPATYHRGRWRALMVAGRPSSVLGGEPKHVHAPAVTEIA
jgi:hypothetical protein